MQLTSNALWDNEGLASGLAGVVTDSLGLPNVQYSGTSAGPLFAYTRYTVGAEPIAGSWWNPTINSADYAEVYNTDTYTYATATATAVPWETDAISVIGSTILFAGGLWARNKFARPIQK